MRAVRYERYGGPERLRLVDLPTPQPGSDEVLVRVRAASLNSWDWDLLRGRPLITRLGGGLRRPPHPVLGADVAGDVVAVGAGVTEFGVGDRVHGDLSGARWAARNEVPSRRLWVTSGDVHVFDGQLGRGPSTPRWRAVADAQAYKVKVERVRCCQSRTKASRSTPPPPERPGSTRPTTDPTDGALGEELAAYKISRWRTGRRPRRQRQPP
ncbi:alcohol dehydrogenase catalytic domain-containing protein, partial [Agromyces humi]|uniref:alcohol dehydrogenase catalytic domain-containing protein n=1 Tax=Agromyces humi TaxID=1766800 RepID=UPI00135994FB